MSLGGYLIDLVTRSFFIFLVAFLITRWWWLSLLLAGVISGGYELIWGRKYWRQLRQRPKTARRSFKTLARDFWRRVCDRRRTKGLVSAGIVLLLFSAVVPLKVYYVVVAGLVFGLAAVSRFAPPVKDATLEHESVAHAPSSQTASVPPPTA